MWENKPHKLRSPRSELSGQQRAPKPCSGRTTESTSNSKKLLFELPYDLLKRHSALLGLSHFPWPYEVIHSGFHPASLYPQDAILSF